MPEDRAHNTVPGTVHGQVNQVGTVQGDLNVYSAPGPAQPSAELAVRIAGTIADPAVKQKALTQIGMAIFETDPDRGEQVLARTQDPFAQLWLAGSIAPYEPERAIGLAEPFLDADPTLRVAALIVCIQARADPDRVREAENTALAVTDRTLRDIMLRRVANAVAPADVDRAIEILAKISPDWWASDYSAPETLRQAAAVHQDYARTLFDHYNQALHRDDDGASDSQRQIFAVAAVDLDVHRAEAMATRISDDSHRVRALTGMAEKIATTDREQALRWLTTARDVALAQGHGYSSQDLLAVVAASAVDPEFARETTRLLSSETTTRSSPMDLCTIAFSLSRADPAEAEQLVDRALAQKLRAEYVQPTLLRIARAFADLDPARALRTLDRVRVEPGNEYQHAEVAEILTKVAGHLAVWDAAEAKSVLNRALWQLRAVRSTTYALLPRAWENFAETLVKLDPGVVERLAAQMADRDDVLAAMATGVVRACGSRTA